MQKVVTHSTAINPSDTLLNGLLVDAGFRRDRPPAPITATDRLQWPGSAIAAPPASVLGRRDVGSKQ